MRLVLYECNFSHFLVDQMDILDVGVVKGVAINWVNKHIYWTDVLFSRVEVAHLDGSGRRVLFEYLESKDVQLGGVALYPQKG